MASSSRSILPSFSGNCLSERLLALLSMWLPWRKISRSKSSVPISLCSAAAFSFKDVHVLLHDEKFTTASKPPSAIFRHSLSAAFALRSCSPHPPPSISVPSSGENRIVVYYTSLRIVRRTFEDCRTVRSILRGFRVAIDERDLSMDSRFLAELEGILGVQKPLTLPRVFIGGRHVGGADEIWHLHETGELKKFVEGLPPAALGVCQRCGGVRFVLCQSCNGSHKCSNDKGGGFRTCPSCNEYGLARCPGCSL